MYTSPSAQTNKPDGECVVSFRVQDVVQRTHYKPRVKVKVKLTSQQPTKAKGGSRNIFYGRHHDVLVDYLK